MPRKNYGMWYEVHPTPVKGEDGKNLVYITVMTIALFSLTTWRVMVSGQGPLRNNSR